VSAALTQAALAIAASVFASLWVGALIVGAVWLALRCVPKLGAATRYAIWLCSLAALVLIPLLTAGLSEQPSGPASDLGQGGVPSRVLVVDGPPPLGVAQAATVPAALASPAVAAAPHKSRITIPQSLAVAVALIWSLLSLGRGLLLLLDVRELAVVRREAWLWSTAHDYPVFLSHRVRVPIAFGFSRTAIILPASLVEELRGDALEAIVIHEVAHLRRCDVWTNAFARIAEALLAFNPAAWFVMRRLSIEREIACDDWVVARTGAGDAFARVLARMASFAGSRVPIAAPSALGSRNSLVVRIERLLDARPRSLRLSPSALGGALALLALIALTVQSVSPVLAYESQPGNLAQGSTAPSTAACATPNRAILMTPRVSAKSARLEWELDAHRYRAVFGETNVATFDLTVDAAGVARKVVVLSAPRYRGMVEHVTRVLSTVAYEPALHDCVAFTAAIKGAGLPFIVHRPFTRSVVAPLYPDGWSAQNPSSCKVTVVDRGGGSVLSTKPYPEFLPAVANAMPNLSVDAKYRTSVRVHVDAAGAVTKAVMRPSGLPVLDHEVLAAALRSKYPLTPSTCKPLPDQYEWRTTFSRGTFP